MVSKVLKAIGLMSGTSLDGIDIALLETDGESIVRHGHCATIPYRESERELLELALAEAVNISSRDARPGKLRDIERQLTEWHGHVVGVFLRKLGLGPLDIDLIGFHGQTIIHRPEMALTVQLGDGLALAKQTGISVVYDMRAADVAAGGQGAPLVPVYHRALVAAVPKRPVAVVNIGGVANVSWIGPDGELVAFDTGPGNALIDDWMKSRTGQSRDEGGAMALKGQVNETVAAQFLAHEFFAKADPKSLDRNSFAGIVMGDLSVEDGAATLVAVTARSIAAAREHFPSEPKRWIICGGGRHNKAIMSALTSLLPNVEPAEKFGFDGDSLEAAAWAYLAVRSVRKLPLTFPGTTGVVREMTGGVLAKA